VNDVQGHIYANDAEGKSAVIDDACISLQRTALLFNLDGALMDRLETLAPPGSLPNFVELDRAAKEKNVAFTPDLAALLAVIALRGWHRSGAKALSFASYLDFDELEGDPRRIELLRPLLDACAELAEYQLGHDAELGRASEAFRALAGELQGWDPEVAVACALNACSIAPAGRDVTAAANTLIQVAAEHNDDAAALGLMYRVVGLYRLRAEDGTATDLEIYDAFEAACRHHPKGPAKDIAKQILGQLGADLEFLRPHVFLWRCAFEPETLDPELPFVRSYADTVWNYDDTILGEVLMQLRMVLSDLENFRLDMLPQDQGAVAIANLNKWSIDHQAFRRAVPFSSSMLREANQSDLLLTLSHEMIHMQSAQGWLGINLLALRMAAIECETRLLGLTGQLPTENSDAEKFGFPLAELTDSNVVMLAFVEQQLELVRKSQLLRAIWLPWLEGLAIFGELSADPQLDSELSTAFSDAVSALSDVTPGEVAREKGLSVRDAAMAIRADAEKLYSDALADSGLARLRSYLDGGPERYLPGYLAVRAVLTSLRRQHDFNGLTGYQALIGMTMVGTRLAVPDLTLSPEEFEAQGRAMMLNWLGRITALDRRSVENLAGATPWRWDSDGLRERVLAQVEDQHDLDSIAEMAALAKDARNARGSRDSEFGNLTEADASMLGDVLEVVAAQMPPANEQALEALAYHLNDHISLVPIAQVTAPFWLSLGGEVPRLAVGIRVTETERKFGRPSYSLCMLPLSAEQLEHLQQQMRVLRGTRMEVRRYADAAGYRADIDEGRGLGRNVLGLVYGDFTLVLPAGQFFGREPSPSLTTSVENRLRPPPIRELDAVVAAGSAIAKRAIEWIESPDFSTRINEGLGLGPEIAAWSARVLELARIVMKDDDVRLVTEVGELILAELGWEDGTFASVRESGLRALYDDESPMLAPLLKAAMVSGVGLSEPDTSELPEGVTSRLFELTERGYDFRRLRGATQ
jgi:hypothetical protein